jgi:predicted nucleotidyltransferase
MNSMLSALKFDNDRLQALCRRYEVRRVALFGSVLRNDFGPASDVDVLVEFQPGARVGLRLITLQDELAALFGRSVDLNTAGFLSPHFRERVLREAAPIYEAA